MQAHTLGLNDEDVTGSATATPSGDVRYGARMNLHHSGVGLVQERNPIDLNVSCLSSFGMYSKMRLALTTALLLLWLNDLFPLTLINTVPF